MFFTGHPSSDDIFPRVALSEVLTYYQEMNHVSHGRGERQCNVSKVQYSKVLYCEVKNKNKMCVLKMSK